MNLVDIQNCNLFKQRLTIEYHLLDDISDGSAQLCISILNKVLGLD